MASDIVEAEHVDRAVFFIILDMNGVLMERGSGAASTIKSDFTVMGRPCYKRPGSDEFVSFCRDSFQGIGIWTSMLAKNAVPCVKHMLCIDNDKAMTKMEQMIDKPWGVESEKLPLCMLWTQNSCMMRNFWPGNDHASHKAFKPVMFKDLNLLWHGGESIDADRLKEWEHVAVGSRGSFSIVKEKSSMINNIKIHTVPELKEYPKPSTVPPRPLYPTPQNTILVDDTAYKYALTPFNGINVPSFSIDTEPRNDNELAMLMKYLKELLSDAPSDVRIWIKQNPYDEFVTRIQLEAL